MPASSLHSCLHLGTWAKHPPPPPAAACSSSDRGSSPRPRCRSRLRDPSGGRCGTRHTGTSRKDVRVTQGNPKTKRGGGVSGFAGGVRASTERHSARPPASRSLEKRRMLKAHPRVSGLQKLRTTKLNTKGRISVRASHPLSGAGPWRSPCRAVGFVSLPPSRRQTARGETRGAAAPRARRSRAPASAACPGCSSHLVVNVGWALGGHLLDNVDGVPVVPAHLLVVRAVVVLCSP